MPPIATLSQPVLEKARTALQHNMALILMDRAAKQVASLQHQLASLVASNSFVQQLVKLSAITDIYNNNHLQELALAVIPFDLIDSQVESHWKTQEASTDTNTHYSKDDLFVKYLLKWFKNLFFTWTNKLPCPLCHNSDQLQIALVGHAQPTAVEKSDGDAGSVEIYRCAKCRHQYRFPRYNSPAKLLETRQGRCGEWANCFYLILHSLGMVDVRYVWNLEDHVWTEYYSTNFQKWIHLDSCEEAYDQPLIYCNNWGKKMSYVVAIGPLGMRDVSKRYIDMSTSKDKQLPRTKVSEKNLFKVLQFLDLRKKISYMRNTGDDLKIYQMFVRDIQEMKWLQNHDGVDSLVGDMGEKGRISGSKDWKAQRGENGGKK